MFGKKGEVSYRFLFEAKDGESGKIHVFAGRGKISAYGSAVVHAGILLLVSAVFWGGASGFRRYVRIIEGDSFVEPSRNFLVRIDKLEVDFYEPEKEEAAEKDFLLKDVQGTITVLEDGDHVLTKVLEVGGVLRFKGVGFKIDYKGLGWPYRLRLTNKHGWQWALSAWPWCSGIPLSELNWMIYLHHLYPDFALDGEGKPFSRTPFLRNPAVQVWIQEGELEPVLIGWLKPGAPLEHEGYTIEIFDFKRYVSLHISKHPGLPVIWAGIGFIIAGLILVYFTNYRRVWITISARDRGTDVILSGSTAGPGKITERNIDSLFFYIRKQYSF